MRTRHALQRQVSGTLAALLACGWLLLALAACAPAAATSTPPAPYFSATDVSMDSPIDGWGVGKWITPATLPYSAPAITTAMAHYHDGKWRLAPRRVMGDIGSDQPLYLIRMLSSTDGWATTRGAIYHYDGVRWSLALPAMASMTLADLAMYSPDVGWAVGPDGILQYTHGAWVNVTASLPPPPAGWESQWPYPGLRSVAIASPTDVWAMGDGGMIWHYDGARWRIAASPYFPNRFYTSPSVDGYTASDATLAHFAIDAHSVETLYASQMLSPAQGWSVGGTAFAAGSINWGPAVVEQYRGGAWQVAHVVPRATQPSRWPVFFCLALTSLRDDWMGGAWAHPTLVGSGDTPPAEGNPTYTTLLLHYHAGQWSFVSAPAVGAIHRLVMLSADDGWAAADGGLLHYSGRQWRLVSAQPAG